MGQGYGEPRQGFCRSTTLMILVHVDIWLLASKIIFQMHGLEEKLAALFHFV